MSRNIWFKKHNNYKYTRKQGIKRESQQEKERKNRVISINILNFGVTRPKKKNKQTKPRNESLSIEIRKSMESYNNKLDIGKEGNISWNTEQKTLE